ncbi:MAG: hypothetical protein ACP5D2_04585, partial [Candidatus Nanoarchaeia archaeon]
KLRGERIMPKYRKEPYKSKLFNLSNDVIEKIEQISNFEGISLSETIEFVIKNWDAGVNPSEKLINLTKEREKLQEKMSVIDKEIGKVSQHIKLFEDWRKQKQKRKGQAVKIIERYLLDNSSLEQVETIAKSWQRMTGIPAIELLLEAKENIENKGI